MATSLYIGDVDVNVTEEELRRLFEQIGEVASVKLCMDEQQSSLGYGYVNYINPDHAAKAIEELNSTRLNTKCIRIAYSNRDASLRRSRAGNLFVKNLDKEIDHKVLHKIFSSFGNIISVKVETDDSGVSKGYGFVHYDDEEDAQEAIEQLNGALVYGRDIYVAPFMSKEEREESMDKTKYTNVFVKNLSESTNEDDLNTIFGEFGSITSLVVIRDADGNSKCFGFVNFESVDDALKSVEALNGRTFNNKEWYVGRAQKKSERERELKINKLSNIYIKNLEDKIDEGKLKFLFSPFGTIKSCKLMCDARGISKGCGFIAFSTHQEASTAISNMNGKMIHGKPIYVAIAERKEDRKARLQSLFNNLRPGTPTLSPQTSPLVGQNIFYGHAPPAAIPPPMPRFGYQHQLLPGVTPFGSPFSNVPSNITRPVGIYSVASQLRLPMIPHQQMFRMGNTNLQYGTSNIPGRGDTREVHTPRGNWASALANSSPREQKKMLGAKLYPLVKELDEERANKVTGMLLEMDHTEILHLIESPQSLQAKVAEAVQLLNKYNTSTN